MALERAVQEKVRGREKALLKVLIVCLSRLTPSEILNKNTLHANGSRRWRERSFPQKRMTIRCTMEFFSASEDLSGTLLDVGWPWTFLLRQDWWIKSNRVPYRRFIRRAMRWNYAKMLASSNRRYWLTVLAKTTFFKRWICSIRRTSLKSRYVSLPSTDHSNATSLFLSLLAVCICREPCCSEAQLRRT